MLSSPLPDLQVLYSFEHPFPIAITTALSFIVFTSICFGALLPLLLKRLGDSNAFTTLQQLMTSYPSNLHLLRAMDIISQYFEALGGEDISMLTIFLLFDEAVAVQYSIR